MLAPEIWDFAPPTCSVSQKSSTDQNIYENIKKQLFVHHVSITLPNVFQVPEEIINPLVEDTQFYKISRVNVKEFVNRNFVDLFVKHGQVTGLSINTVSGEDEGFALIPSGKLILTLTKTSYEKLGISRINKDKSYLLNFVVLDMVSLSANEKKFEEIIRKVSSLNLFFDIVVLWEPPETNICPSSIAQYFSDIGYHVKICDIKYKHQINYNVNVPLFDEDSDPESFSEWLGALNLQCNMHDDNYISTFNCLEKTELCRQVSCAHFTGLFSSVKIQKFLGKIIEYVKNRSSRNWIGVVFQSFENSLLSIKDDKYFQIFGETHHAVILNPGSLNCLRFFTCKNSI